MTESQKKKVDQEHDFYYEEGKIHLYDADAFISQVKHMMVGIVKDMEFGIYFGISEEDCLDVWLRDENGVMYQVQPKQLADDESEISIAEAVEEEDDERRL